MNDSLIDNIQNINDYKKQYQFSIENSDEFWSNIAERITWYKKWDKVSDINFETASIKWFKGGKLNASYNCLDRHIEKGYGEKCALIWEGNNPKENKKYTYNELLEEVSKFSNALKSLGAIKGDRICIYMQMIPELTIAMLAILRH